MNWTQAHTHYASIIIEHREHACWMESGPVTQRVLVMFQWTSSGHEWMCSPVQRNSSAALKNRKLITHQSPDHSMSYLQCHLLHHMDWYIHTTHNSWSPLSNTNTHLGLCQLICPQVNLHLCLLVVQPFPDIHQWTSVVATVYTTLVWDSLTDTCAITPTSNLRWVGGGG